MKIKLTDISSVGASEGQVPRVNSAGELEWDEAASGGSTGAGGSFSPFPVNVPTTSLFPFSANGGTVTTEMADSPYGLMFRRSDSGTGSDVAGFRGKNVPAGSSWTAIIGIRTTPARANSYIRQGVAVHESATGKTELITYNTQNSDPRISGLYLSNLVTYGTGWYDSSSLSDGPLILYFKIVFDGTSYVFSYSLDYMATWTVAGTRSGFTADKIGLVAENYGSGAAGNRMQVIYYVDPDFPYVAPEVREVLPDLTDKAGKVLAVKNDETGIEWVNVATSGPVESYATAAYWRIKATDDATAGAGFFAVGELQFLDADGVNRATGGSSLSSSVYSGSWPSSNAFDANTSTSWVSANASVKNEWIGYNFGTPVSVRTVRLCPSSDFLNGLPSTVLIEYSTDNGATWNSTDTVVPGQGVSNTYQVFLVSKVLSEGAPLQLPDTTDNAGKILAVTSDSTDVEWIDAPSGSGGSGLPSGGTVNQVLVSNGSNGATWKTVENGLGGGPAITEPYGKHAYWRIVHLGGTHPNYVVHTELLLRSTPNGTNVATGGTPIQSGNYGTNVAANAFDGNSSTYWESNNVSLSSGGNWLGYQFASPVSITEVVSAQNGAEDLERVTSGKIQYSDDGAVWVDAWTFSGWNTVSVGTNTTTSPDLRGPTNPVWLVPGGGDVNQVLAKNSNISGDFTWVDQSGGSEPTSFTTDAISGFFGIYGTSGADDTTAYAAKGTAVKLLQNVEIDGIYGFTSITSGQSVRGFVAEFNTTTNAIVGTVYYTPTIAYNAGGTYYANLTAVARFNAGTNIVVGFIRSDSTGTASINFPGSTNAKMQAPVSALNYQYRWNTTTLTDGQVASSNYNGGTYPVTIVGRAVSDVTYKGSTDADLVAVPTRVSARYWRVLAPADVVSSDNWIGIGELKWLTDTDQNLATGGTAFASGQYDGGWVAAKAFDGSLADNSGWISTNGQKVYQWLAYDFGSAVTPYKLSIAPISNYAGTLPSKLNVEFSYDGTTWFYVSQITINRTPGAGVYQDFTVPVFVNPNTVGLTVKNYQSRIIKTAPSFIQQASLRNDGVLALTNAPTPGNLLVLMTAGFAGSMSAYIPSGFGIAAQYYSNTNNMVALYTKIATSNDTGAFSMSASDNQQAIVYEFKDATGVIPLGGGTLSYTGSTGTISLPQNPFSLNSPILLAIEHDTSVQITFSDNLNLTKDYSATDANNHKGAFARFVGNGGTVTVAAGGDFTSPVWGSFALVGKQIIYNANEVVKLPEGGNTGQVLAKASTNNGDVAWVTPAGGAGSGVPNGGTTGQILSKTSDVDGEATWVDNIAFADAPDASMYVRKNNDWVDIDTAIEAGILNVGNPEPYGKHLYWRARFTAAFSATDLGITVYEMRMKATSADVDQTSGGTPTASTVQDATTTNQASNAFDKSTGSFWRSSSSIVANNNEWLAYQFPVPVSVTTVEFWSSSTRRPIAGVIEYSDDGVAWNAAWTFSSLVYGAPNATSTAITNSPDYSPSTNDGRPYVRQNGVWTPQPFDVPFYIPMAPTGSMEVFAHKFIRKMTLKAGLPGTSIEARVQATASSAWTISKNSTAIGTITWAAGATVPTIAFTADVLFDVGDWLVITSAAMPDTTLNRIAGTIVMERRA